MPISNAQQMHLHSKVIKMKYHKISFDMGHSLGSWDTCWGFSLKSYICQAKMLHKRVNGWKMVGPQSRP